MANIWRCKNCGQVIDGIPAIEEHDMECQPTERVLLIKVADAAREFLVQPRNTARQDALGVALQELDKSKR